MKDACNVDSDKQLGEYFNLSSQAVSLWRVNGVPESRIRKLVRDGKAAREWLEDGSGPGPNSQVISEDLDPETEYQSHADGAPTFKRVLLRLEQAEEIMLSNSVYAAALDAKIKKFYRALHHERPLPDPAKAPPDEASNSGR